MFYRPTQGSQQGLSWGHGPHSALCHLPVALVLQGQLWPPRRIPQLLALQPWWSMRGGPWSCRAWLWGLPPIWGWERALLAGGEQDLVP